MDRPMNQDSYPSDGEGWKHVVATGIDELFCALERAERKGYMPDAIASYWEAFDYRDAAPPASKAQVMGSDDSLGPKAANFIAELEALCRKHGVQLSTSGYDGLQVWNLTDPERPLHCAGIDDRMIEQK